MSSVMKTCSALILALACAGTARAQGLTWETDLNTALQKAVQSNKMVIVHFGAVWCKPCKQLEQNVFNKPGFGSDLQNSFVAVKLDFDAHRDLAQQWGVKAIPADVILTSYGKYVERVQSPQNAERYVASIYEGALRAKSKGPLAGLLAGTPAGPLQPPAPTTQPAAPAQPSASAATPHATAAMQTGYGAATPTAATSNQSAAASPAAPLGPVGLPPGVPPLGLEGNCPVALVERKNWVPGDARWGAIHQGRTYLFSGPAEQQRFLAQPDHYSPALAGNDPVLAIDQQQQVPGAIACGVFYSQRIYLFQSPDTLAKFRANPDRYTSASGTIR
ncbi:MAG: thioredoxin family protein [Planctomycetes bacterium]|nr:thioredoxin family protein [Planctomycetota bacterium]